MAHRRSARPWSSGSRARSPVRRSSRRWWCPGDREVRAELISFCQERLANFKVPQVVEFREEIPKSPLGKILRKYLLSPTLFLPPPSRFLVCPVRWGSLSEGSLTAAAISGSLCRSAWSQTCEDAADRQLRLLHLQPLPAAGGGERRGAGRRPQRRRHMDRAGAARLRQHRRSPRARAARRPEGLRRLRATRSGRRGAAAGRVPRPPGPRPHRAAPRWSTRPRSCTGA